MKAKNVVTTLEIVMFVIGLLLLVGWIKNIVFLFNADFTPLTGELIVRLLGVPLFPIGAIAGWL